MTEGNYAEVEIMVLGLIGSLDNEEAMSAIQIGDLIECTWQKCIVDAVKFWSSKI